MIKLENPTSTDPRVLAILAECLRVDADQSHIELVSRDPVLSSKLLEAATTLRKIAVEEYTTLVEQASSVSKVVTHTDAVISSISASAQMRPSPERQLTLPNNEQNQIFNINPFHRTFPGLMQPTHNQRTLYQECKSTNFSDIHPNHHALLCINQHGLYSSRMSNTYLQHQAVLNRNSAKIKVEKHE